MSVTAIFEITVKPETRDDALAILAEALEDTRAFDGCESVRLVIDHADPCHFLAVETWASLEHDAAYRAWRAGDGAITEMPALLAGPPRLTLAVPA